MSVAEWILLGAYVLGWLLFAPVLARALVAAVTFDGREPDKFERIGGSFIGMLAALFWPLVIPLGWVYRQAFGKRAER